MFIDQIRALEGITTWNIYDLIYNTTFCIYNYAHFNPKTPTGKMFNQMLKFH